MSYGEPIVLHGDVSGSGPGSTITTALAATGVAAGVYGSSSAIPVFTIDAKGRVTSATTAPITNTPALTQAFVVAVADASLPNARVLKAGIGVGIVDNGPSGLVISRDRTVYLKYPYYYEPFWSGNNSYFVAATYGSGATILQGSGTAAKPGGLILTVKGSTDRVSYACSPTMLYFGGGTAVEFQTEVRVETLSGGNDRFSFRVGFLDTTSADAVDGIYFEYDASYSLYWRICTSSNSTRTKVATNVSVTQGTNYVLYYFVAADGSYVDFYINGTYVGRITTNIPNVPGRETGLSMLLLKTAGINSRSVDIAYMFFQAGV
jgi:hypothetical protein